MTVKAIWNHRLTLSSSISCVSSWISLFFAPSILPFFWLLCTTWHTESVNSMTSLTLVRAMSLLKLIWNQMHVKCLLTFGHLTTFFHQLSYSFCLLFQPYSIRIGPFSLPIELDQNKRKCQILHTAEKFFLLSFFAPREQSWISIGFRNDSHFPPI